MTRPDPHRTAVLFDRIEADLAELRSLVAPPAEPSPAPRREDFLEPGIIAERMGLSASQVRRECQLAFKRGLPGVEQDGQHWRATIATIRAVRAGRGLAR
jgi:hypothetical protein